MNGRAHSLLVGLVAFLVGTLPASAQKHEDTKLGFEFRPPKDFRPIAIDPLETITVAKYQAEQKEFGSEWGQAGNSMFEIRYYANSDIQENQTREDYIAKLWEGLEREYGFSEVTKDKSIKIDRQEALERSIQPTAEDKPFTVYAAILDQEDGVYVFWGVSLKQRYKKYEGEFSKAAKSFKRIEKHDIGAREAELAQMDDQERFLQRQIDKLPPGWSHLRTKRYVFLYNADKGFVKELSDQIEAIRDEYEKDYPPSKPIEAISIVRVCATHDEFVAYGGGDSGGFFNSEAKELVIFDQPPRSTTKATLNHEAFHQYIYYFYGELSPHSWYNEGTGDYYGGANMTKTFRITGFGDLPEGFARRELVKESCRLLGDGKEREGQLPAATPLKQLMAYHQQGEFYDPDQVKRVVHYSQAWALIHMLRESKKLEPKWQEILPEYLTNLLAAREEVAQKAMERHLEQMEKKKKGSSDGESRDPRDYYRLAPEEEIQDVAFAKTFAGWTDDDWTRFQDFYLDYVEKELPH